MNTENKNYLKKLLIIAVPIMLSNVITQIQMIIDRIFLGQINTLYLSAMGNVTSLLWTTMSFCFSITIGSSILISQSVGARDQERAHSYAASMVKWNNIIPVFLCFFWLFCGKIVFQIMGISESVMPYCLGYTKFYAPIFLLIGLESSYSVIMQTANYTQPLVYFGLVRAGLNIVLDWIMIPGRFGVPAMGIEGAAIATTIAEVAGFLFAQWIVVRKNLKTKPSFAKILSAPLKPFLSTVRLGVNVALEDFAWNLGNLVLIRILNSINETAAAIYSMVFGVEVLIIVVIGAIGNGTMTLCGEARGAKDRKQFVQVCKIACMLCFGVALVSLVISLGMNEKILGLFTKDQALIASSGIYLIMVCLNLFGKSANIIIGNGIRGSGNTIWMLYTQLFGTMLVIGSALFFVFVLRLGIAGVFAAVIVDEGVRALINFFKLRQIVRIWN